MTRLYYKHCGIVFFGRMGRLCCSDKHYKLYHRGNLSKKEIIDKYNKILDEYWKEIR